MKKLLLIALLAAPSVAFAKADPTGGHAVSLGARVTLIQCGHSSEMEETCKKEPRCCVFLEPAAGDQPAADSFENHMCEIYQSPEYFQPVCVKIHE